jgi:L-malate glycosyltransferase
MPDAPYRILQLASTSDMGGTERMVLFLAEALNKNLFETHVACLIGSGELLNRAAPHCKSVRHLQFRGLFDPQRFIHLIEYIREHRIELVQCYGLRADTAGRIAAKLGGARVIVSSIRSIDPWRRWSHTFIDRMTAPLVNFWISNSEAGKQACIKRERLPADKIHVVYGGIPSRDIPRGDKDQIRRDLNIEPDVFPVIGILANLRDMKGHRDIIQALPAILRLKPDCVFIFAGRDDSNGAIERMARETTVSHAIRFTGYVADTTRLLAVMDMFMLPSHWEGLPASILEAMHAALPIIATRVGGIPELVRNGEVALLIAAGQPDQIANAVIKLSSDWPLRARLAKAAEVRAQTVFSLEQMVHKTEDLYANALRPKT